VEALVVDLTHRVCVLANVPPAPFLTLSFSFFVEVSNFDPAASNSPHFLSPRSDNPAEFRLSACVHLFLRSGVS
jgi:hypothetical protein